ncbi:MAG TPA: amidohydrolase family protein [Burkholderiales bacterium]|nr:amidohydrolase family protein [Burkholderiales bacterium]
MSRAFTIPGPQPDTRKPRLKLPPGSCDCHAHVFGPQSRYPFLHDAKYIAPDASPEDYVRMLRTIGCDRAVLVQPSVYGTDNTAMLDALRSGIFPFRGVAVVDENITDRELEDLHAAGVRGVRINLAAWTPGLKLDQAPRLAARIKPLGWHLQFFVDFKKVPELEDHLTTLDIDIVLDHFGRAPAAEGTGSPSFQTLLRLVSRDNCWAKIMGVYFVSERYPNFSDVAPLARAVVERAPERTVWATDWPHPMGLDKMPNDGDLADLLADWVPDEAQRKKVLVDNPARLYGF